MLPSLQQAHHHPPEAIPFNITVVKVDAPTSDYDDNEIEEFYHQLKNVIDQALRKDFFVVQEDRNAKVGQDSYENWQSICRPFDNDETIERGLRLLEFATSSDLVMANTFGRHKASKRWTWHSPNEHHHSQIDYWKRFRSGVSITRTRSFQEQTL